MTKSLDSFCLIVCVLKYKGEVFMEPLKRTARKRIFEAAPTATSEEIDEYQRLLAERFTIDPDLPRDPASVNLVQRREARLKELRSKLFPPEAEPQSR